MADSETGTVDEYERQFKYIQALKKLDFFANKNFEGFEEANENESKDERESTFSTIKIGSQSSFDDDYQGENGIFISLKMFLFFVLISFLFFIQKKSG